MKVISPLAIALAMGTPAFAQQQQQIPAPTLLSMKGGDTLPVRVVTFVTATCDPLFLNFEGIDIMEGPPEVSLQFEPGMVHTFTPGRDCPKPVKGGTVMATAAKDIAAQKEALLTFRVRFKTKQGPWQYTVRYRVLLFPSGEHKEPTTATKQ